MPNNDERVEPFENDKQVNDSAKKGKKLKKHLFIKHPPDKIKITLYEYIILFNAALILVFFFNLYTSGDNSLYDTPCNRIQFN